MKRYVNGEYIEMSDEEVTEFSDSLVSDHEETLEDRIQQLEQQNDMLMECLLEMSEIVYG